MLFNSFAFLLVFLPVGARAARARRALCAALAAAAPRRPVVRLLRLLGLALHSAARRSRSSSTGRLPMAFIASKRGVLIVTAIALNLLVLGVFKYANFFAGLDPRPRGLAGGRHFRHQRGAAARHLVLHLPPRDVSRRPQGRRRAALRSRRATRSTSPSSRRCSPARWCAGARSCTSSTSGPTSGPTRPSASHAA